MRILSLRALPDTHVKELKQSIHEENKKTKDPQEAAADEEGGDYYNIECSFAYHSKPANRSSTSSKARNMHMQLVFYLGIKGLFGVPLPIFVELQEIVGTIRLRLQMTPEPPYAKNLTFTLMGVPKVTAGCVPMVQVSINADLFHNDMKLSHTLAWTKYVSIRNLASQSRPRSIRCSRSSSKSTCDYVIVSLYIGRSQSLDDEHAGDPSHPPIQ